MNNANILVVEDEPDILNGLQKAFSKEGYNVDVSASGDIGLAKALTKNYDAIVLDILLPNIDGFSFVKRLREEKLTPVLMLTALDSTENKVQGLDLGADDYLTKPFDLNELKARLRVLLRQKSQNKAARIVIGNLTLDTLKRQVAKEGGTISLTNKEYFILEHLAMNQGKVVTRDELLELFIDDNDGTHSNKLDVHVSNIRKKLGRDLITTHRGAGYCIR